jgi:hypothetical protein
MLTGGRKLPESLLLNVIYDPAYRQRARGKPNANRFTPQDFSNQAWCFQL